VPEGQTAVHVLPGQRRSEFRVETQLYLSRVDLRGTDLSGADLTGARLDNVRSDVGTRWPAGHLAS